MKQKVLRFRALCKTVLPSLFLTLWSSASALASPIGVVGGYQVSTLEKDRFGTVLVDDSVIADGVLFTQDDLPGDVIQLSRDITGASGADGLITSVLADLHVSLFHDGSDATRWLLDLRFTYDLSVEATGEDSAVSIQLRDDEGAQVACVDTSGSVCGPLAADQGAMSFSVLLEPNDGFGMRWMFELSGQAGQSGGEGAFAAEMFGKVEVTGIQLLTAPTEVPEPASVLLLGLGLLGAGLSRR